MRTLTKEQQQLMDWDNELRFESAEYSDTKVCNIAKKACEFVFRPTIRPEEIWKKQLAIGK